MGQNIALTKIIILIVVNYITFFIANMVGEDLYNCLEISQHPLAFLDFSEELFSLIKNYNGDLRSNLLLDNATEILLKIEDFCDLPTLNYTHSTGVFFNSDVNGCVHLSDW